MRNKFDGVCFICGCSVPAGQGYFQRMNGKWLVRCTACVGKGNVPKVSS